MKKMFFIFSWILLLSSIVTAQTNPQKPVKWQIFAPEGEEFSVESPFSLTSDNYGFTIY